MINQFLFETILKEGQKLGIPSDKKRAIIREYLQSRIIFELYGKSDAHFLSFIGGTSLRILRNIDRFSEDLDFDNLGLNYGKIKKYFSEIAENFKREDYQIEFSFKKINNSGKGSFKFLNLLFPLGLSAHQQEKLEIRINYTTPRIKPETEVMILSRFGFVQAVVTNKMETLLSQKIRAALTRRDFQPRDFYDIVWLISRGLSPDKKFFPEIKAKNEKEVFDKLKKVYEKNIKPNLKLYQKRLAPFLINPDNIRYLEIFGQLMETKIKD